MASTSLSRPQTLRLSSRCSPSGVFSLTPSDPLSPLEVAWGWVPGIERQPAWSLRATTRAEVRAALDDVLREALLRPPCAVLFSGGRDSSLLLAAAVDLARREGHALPVATTLRFPAAPDVEEEAWQETVIDHVGPLDWVKTDITDEFDIVGPIAARGLRKHGVMWPPLVHNAEVLLPALKGGTLIDGEGGDEILGGRRSAPFAQLVRRKRPPGPRLARKLAEAMAPRSVRARRSAALWGERPWLRPDTYDELKQRLAEDTVAEPLSWPRALQVMSERRAARLGMAHLDRAAADHDVTRIHPLLDLRFLSAWAGFGGRFGFSTRTDSLRNIADDLLPDIVLRRASKATFNVSAVGPHARAFIARWDGSGVDPSLVDVEALRTEWNKASVSGATFLLLQQAWLASERLHP